MRHYGSDFLLRQTPQQSGAGSDGGMVRTATRGKGIGLVGVQDKKPLALEGWHCQPVPAPLPPIPVLTHGRPDGHCACEATILTEFHHEKTFIAAARRKAKKHPSLARQQKPDQHKEHGHCGQQKSGFDKVQIIGLSVWAKVASRDGFLVASGVRWASNRVESTGDQFFGACHENPVPRKPDPAIAKRALQGSGRPSCRERQGRVGGAEGKRVEWPEGPGSYPIRGLGKQGHYF